VTPGISGLGLVSAAYALGFVSSAYAFGLVSAASAYAVLTKPKYIELFGECSDAWYIRFRFS
jgi:hypothetical protein